MEDLYSIKNKGYCMKKIYLFIICCTTGYFIESSDITKGVQKRINTNSSQPLQIPKRQQSKKTVSSGSISPEFIQFAHSPTSFNTFTGVYCLGQYILNYTDENSPRDSQ